MMIKLNSSDYFNDGLHYLGKKGEKLFVINIGAMDGVTFDEMVGYTKMYNFKGLYVEPIPVYYNLLKENYNQTGNLFENSAISDYNGEIKMMTIDKTVIDKGLVHEAFLGMSAVCPPKNGLGSEGDKQVVDKYGKEIVVPCITFDFLLKKHNISSFDVVKIDAEGHDYNIFKQIDLNKYKPKIIRTEWVSLSDDEREMLIKKLDNSNYIYGIEGQDIVGITKDLHDKIYPSKKNSNITIVTGLWDIKRDKLEGNWSRNYEEHYLKKFKEFLKIPYNLIIFGDSELKKFVFENKTHDNIQFIERDLSWFRRDFYDSIQKIRLNPQWYNQVGWLKESTQGSLDFYNPIVMSKVYLLHDAKITDRFDSTHMFWLDAGITNTVHPGYFTHDRVLDKLDVLDKITFLSFPYETTSEIHGFTYDRINEYAGDRVNKVCRGGFFGGPKSEISDFNSQYYGLMKDTLDRGLMGTEESLFTIMIYKYPERYRYFEIDGNGLINKFFEDLKNDNHKIKSESKTPVVLNNLKTSNTALYVLTFNSPKQFETLMESFYLYDKNFIDKPEKFLINNSTDDSTDARYEELCDEYGFTQIRFKENLGICGGRQFIAEHADENGFDFHMFFEDDMFFYNGKKHTCRNGFNRYVDNLYDNVLEICRKENFDYLKFSYSEFFGDNGTQWSWYNIPQDVREEYFPDKKQLPIRGTDPDAPRTKFNNIRVHNRIPYADGEVYYSNWPQVMSRDGAKKVFLTEKWARPYEQTWMSYTFQQIKKGNIKSGLLLITPTEHDRFEHYDGKLRKES